MDKFSVGRAGTGTEAEAIPSGGGAAEVEVCATVCPVVGWIKDREIHVRHHITEHITK